MAEMHNPATSEEQGKQGRGIKAGMLILHLLMCNLAWASPCLHGTALCHQSKPTQSSFYCQHLSKIWYYLQEKTTWHDLNIHILVMRNVFITNTCKENTAMFMWISHALINSDRSSYLCSFLSLEQTFCDLSEMQSILEQCLQSS